MLLLSCWGQAQLFSLSLRGHAGALQPLCLVLTCSRPLGLFPPWASGLGGASIQSLHTTWALLGVQVQDPTTHLPGSG